MDAETEWYPERLLLLWAVKRRLWSNFAGSAYQVHKYKSGFWRKFWTRKGAQERADALNAKPPGASHDQ
jgi:hypothetical protein